MPVVNARRLAMPSYPAYHAAVLGRRQVRAAPVRVATHQRPQPQQSGVLIQQPQRAILGPGEVEGGIQDLAQRIVQVAA